MAKIEEITEDTLFTAVLYTDGACAGNPGFYGSGVHGYIYRDEDIEVKNTDKAPANNIITTIGYTNKPINANNKLAKLVKPFNYINAMFSFGYEIGTNNVAEIVATTKMLEYLIEHEYNFKHIIIKTDSSYVEGIYHKLIHKEATSYNYKEVPGLKNAEYYEIIDKLIDKLNLTDTKLTLKKVKGHSDDMGNNLADSLAVTGRLIGRNGIEGDYVKFYSGVKYWKPTIVKHPFLRVNQLFFTHQDRKTIGENKYVIMDYDIDIEVGKKTHGAMFGLIELNKLNSKDIENILQIDKDISKGLSTLTSVDMTVYYSQFHKVYKELCGDLVYTNRGNHLEVMGDIPIVSPVFPQGLAKASLDKALTLNETLDRYKEYREGKLLDSEELYYVDITELIYDISGKKPKILLDGKDKFLKVKIDVNNKPLTLTIPLKRELVDRNTLKQLEKNEPKVFIEVNVINKNTFTYNSIVDIGDEIGVYTNFYTTTTVI